MAPGSFRRDVLTNWEGSYTEELFRVQSSGPGDIITNQNSYIVNITRVNPGVADGAYIIQYNTFPEKAIALASISCDGTASLNAVDVEDGTSVILTARKITNNVVMTYNNLGKEPGPVQPPNTAVVYITSGKRLLVS